MENIPNKIYLQIGEDAEVNDFNDLYFSDITWSDDCINDNDIEYERRQDVDLKNSAQQRELLLNFLTWYMGDEHSKLPNDIFEIVDLWFKN